MVFLIRQDKNCCNSLVSLGQEEELTAFVRRIPDAQIDAMKALQRGYA